MQWMKRLLAAGLAVAMLGSVPAFAAGTDGLEHFQPVAASSRLMVLIHIIPPYFSGPGPWAPWICLP